VPPVVGFGNQLNEVEAWCRANFHVDQWAYHSHSDKEPGQIPQYYARFYFATAEDAELFRWRWSSETG
jgi:hypothetical protein